MTLEDKGEAKAGYFEDTATAERVCLLLRELWSGNQLQMSATIGCSQAVLSRIVSGKRAPGRKVLTLCGKDPRVNAEWVLTGKGDPFKDPLEDNDLISALKDIAKAIREHTAVVRED